MQESFDFAQENCNYHIRSGTGNWYKTLNICSHLKIRRNFQLWVRRYFIISFVSAEIFLSLHPISPVVLIEPELTRTSVLLSLKIHYTCIILGLYWRLDWTSEVTKCPQSSPVYRVSLSPLILRWGERLGRPLGCLKPNTAVEWCWAWLVHQQFNLLKAVSGRPWIIFNFSTTLSHDINQ